MSETAVEAQEIIGLCKKEGYLAKQLYVVFTTPVTGIKPILENMKEHLAFQVALEKEGIMFAAGPNWTDDEKSWEGDGWSSSAPHPWPRPGRSRNATRCTKAARANFGSGRGSSTKGRCRCGSITRRVRSR